MFLIAGFVRTCRLVKLSSRRWIVFAYRVCRLLGAATGGTGPVGVNDAPLSGVIVASNACGWQGRSGDGSRPVRRHLRIVRSCAGCAMRSRDGA